MTPERHARIQQIFEAAVDLPPAERDSCLRRFCGDDAALLRAVENLLQADSEPDTTSAGVRVCPSCSRCFDSAVSICPADGTPLEPVLHGPLLIDKKYLIERRLGHGGMGAVYQVRHINLEKTFALKLILSDAAALESYRHSFETEGRALGQLKHPNIVEVTDYGIDPRDAGVPYMVMEFLDGETLQGYIKNRGPIPFEEAAPWLRSIASAIDAAHAAGIIHGDLKPGNLLLARQPDGSTVLKVVDFGLARLSGARREIAAATVTDGISSDATTVTMGQIRGTPAYMAPELFRSDAATRSSDLFAFGVIAYQILTGALPFESQGCRGAGTAKPRLPSTLANLPAQLDAPVLALLSPDAAQRPRSATAAVDAMDAAWLDARRLQWRRREIPRRTIFAAILAILAVVIAALLGRAPIARVLEDRTVDARFALTPAHPPDPRWLVVEIDDAALAQDQRPLVEWSDTVSRAIERFFDSGAQRVAIDIHLPEQWSRTNDFTRLVMRHADQLTLAVRSANAATLGTESVSPAAASVLGSDRYLKLFGFVDLEPDADNAIRRSRAAFPSGQVSFAARAIGSPVTRPDPFWIDFSAQPIPVISFRDAGAIDAARLRDRIIFIGSTYNGAGDDWPVARGAKMPGVVLQAEIANTLVRGSYPPALLSPICFLLITLTSFLVAILALRYPYAAWIALVVAGGAAAGYLIVAFLLCRSMRWMIPVMTPEVALFLAAGAAWTLAARLAPYPGKEG